MGSGGVASVSDPLEGIQFSNDEVRAIVEEVENHLVYCSAHIHPDRALKRAIGLGVHCIEHGTLIEPDTANMAADKGVSIVPTLAVIAGLAERGEEFGLPRESLDKLAAGRTTISIAHRLSTAARADRVLVLEHGRLVQDGPHAELVITPGPYARMYEAWVAATTSRWPPINAVMDSAEDL